MRRLFTIFTIAIALTGSSLHTQIASDCTNAIPICNNTPINGGTNGFGMDDFNGANTTGCLERTQTGVIESNSAWYHFRTGESGQLGFNIGHDSAEDWDFALYRASDCNSLGDPVRCNFFDNSANRSYTGVGEDPTGNTLSLLYEDWLDVNAGEDYYLLINNFSNANSGFSIQFSGQIFMDHPNTALDCSIVSNLLGPPIAACEGETITLDATTTGATAYTWFVDLGTGFQVINCATGAMYTVPDDGLYRVQVTLATETIISDVQVAFSAVPMTAVLTDETFCHTAGMLYDFDIKDLEALGSQDPQEFSVSYHSSQPDAVNGMNPLPKQYEIPAGSQTVYVRLTSLENPRCFDASESFELYALETPELLFDQEVPICDNNPVVTIGETIPNPNYTYLWSTGETASSIVVTQPGDYSLTATHSANGVDCTANSTVTVSVSLSPQISAIDINDLMTNNSVTIMTDTDGDFEYRLDQGQFQPQNTFSGVLPGTHTVTVRDLFGCGEVSEEIIVVGFLNHFSPNGDGINEEWQIEGLGALASPIVSLYDRYGKLLAQFSGDTVAWDGTYNGRPLPATDYWFKISYVDNNGARVDAKYIQNHFALRR